jgi:hypothetical protein
MAIKSIGERLRAPRYESGLRTRAPLQSLLNDCDRLSVVERRSFAILVVFARCRLLLCRFSAKFFAAA